MKGAMVIFVAMVVIGVILYLVDVFYYRKRDARRATAEPERQRDAASEEVRKQEDADAKPKEEESEECCGMHAVCEKQSLSPVTADFEYYDDEELDRFAGREPESYTAEEIEEFRDILLTMRPDDVAGWSRSLQVRGVNLPLEVREELLMIVAEQREKPQ